MRCGPFYVGYSLRRWGWTYLHWIKKASPYGPAFYPVEMGGLEPPSNQTINMLSTCLFFLWLSGRGCRKTGHLNLILWGLGCFKGVRTGIPLEMIPHMPGP